METPREFLTALWGDPPPGVVLVWRLPGKESLWYTRLDAVNRDAERHTDEDVYTGVGIASRNGGRFTSRNKLTEEEVGGITGMWADIDWAHPVHRKQNLPPSREQVMETLESALFEPTILVDSGHGIQAWWLFERPWMFDNKEDHELGRRAAQWWHAQVKDLFTERGWITDSVFNLDRIMRLPGTYNNRDPDEPKPVRVIGQTDRRYSPQEFLDLIPSDFRTSAPPPGRKGQRAGRGGGRNGFDVNGSGLVLDPDAQPSMVRFEALMKANAKFRQSWEQDRRDMADTSPSAYDFSLANMAIRAGWPDQEVVNLMIYWRRKHGHDLKLRENYYAITLAKAKEPIEMDEAEEQMKEALSHPPEDQDEVLKDSLSILLGVDILRIQKYLGDPPIYYMHTLQGNITLGEIRAITSQTKFRDAVAAATGVMIAGAPRKVWEARVQAMLTACEEVDLGDHSHPAQETRRWLDEYLLEKPPREEMEWEKGAEAKMPFLRNERTYIFLENFRRWLEMTRSEQMTSRALAQRVRQAGALPETIGVRVGTAKTTRSCWALPLEFWYQGQHRNGGTPE